MKAFLLFMLTAVAGFVPATASALEVVYDGRTPENLREWGERSFVREQMEVLASKICKALYGGTGNENLHENFEVTLFLAPERGGNPAFASGRRITWKVGSNPDGDGSGGTGLLCHEMTHVFDFNAGPMSKQRFRRIYDGVFVEATADWVRNYKVWYSHCTDPSHILDLRYKALRGGRNYGKYLAGANFLDFIEQNYGEGTANRLIWDITANGRHSWERLLGKNIDALVKEWRQMETIYDPVFQWSYNGTAGGKVRNDGKFCGLKSIKAKDSSDKSGAWLERPTEGRVNNIADGSIAIALHGWLPKGGNVAVASLGAAREKSGKALLLVAGPKRDTISAHVVASVPGVEYGIVSTKAISVPAIESKPHSIVMSVRGGDEATVVVDGRPPVTVDMKAKCGGCSFAPAFAVGGMAGGIEIPAIAEPRGEKDGVKLDDVRVFTRAFRERETKNYAATFNEAFRPAVAVTARWCGSRGGTEICDTSKWFCVNAIGERIVALPTKDTDVVVMGRDIPSIPPNSKFCSKSFTIDGLAIVDTADIDLRGVKVVELSDNTRIITRGGHKVAVNALRGGRLRLDGKLAVIGGMKLEGNLEMKGGSILRLPLDPAKACVKSLSVKGEGAVTLKPDVPPKYGHFQRLLRLDEMPKDMTRFRLDPSNGPDDATFKATAGNKFLGATSRKK